LVAATIGGLHGAPLSTDLALRDAAGATVPITVAADPLYANALLVTPNAGFAPGNYELTYRAFSVGDPSKTTFIVDDIGAPLPTSMGTVRVISTENATLVPTYDGACATEAPGVTVTVGADLVAGGWVPWLPVAHFSVLVDGAEYHPQLSICGEDFFGHRVELFGNTPKFSIYKSCPSAPEHHKVTIRGHVPGATSDPEASIEIDLTCASSPADAAPVGNDAATPGYDTVTGPESTSGGNGCTVVGDAGARAGAGILGLASAASLALVVARRRRARSAT
jgi:hypothetical protein